MGICIRRIAAFRAGGENKVAAILEVTVHVLPTALAPTVVQAVRQGAFVVPHSKRIEILPCAIVILSYLVFARPTSAAAGNTTVYCSPNRQQQLPLVAPLAAIDVINVIVKNNAGAST